MQKKYVFLFLSFLLVGCKTSGDLREGRGVQENVDPVGIRTLDAPPSLQKSDDVIASSQPQSVDSLQRQLVVLQGDSENLRYQLEQEREMWRIRFEELEKENKKLSETLAQRAAPVAPAPAKPAASSSGNQDLAEVLWKQAVEAVNKKADAEALVSLKSIIENYPKSRRLWGATLTAGMVEYRLKNFRAAAIHFNNAIDMTAKRSVGVSLPWYFQGLTFLQMKQKADATLFLEELDRKYPRSQANQKAKAILADKSGRLPADPFSDFSNWLDFVKP
jgi:TolA-binding protein